MSGWDRRKIFTYRRECSNDPAFRCEDRTCGPQRMFSCGNGECIYYNRNSQCKNQRDYHFQHSSDSFSASGIWPVCYHALSCATQLLNRTWCRTFCSRTDCTKIIKENCSSHIIFPTEPIAFGHVYFIYNTSKISYTARITLTPTYVCYKQNFCSHIKATVFIDNLTCQYYHQLKLNSRYNSWDDLLNAVMERFFLCTMHRDKPCSNHTHYLCKNSTKCILKYRLVDGIWDCPLDDDENYIDSCSLNDHQRFKCSNGRECISLTGMVFLRMRCNVDSQKNSTTDYSTNELENIFQWTCNGFRKLRNIFIEERVQSDETNCDWWPCNNSYTRCDGVWNCANGTDELNCLPSKCTEFEHPCMSALDHMPICLPIARAGNGIMDCLGGTDEPQLCRADLDGHRFKCRNESKCIPLDFLCKSKYSECIFDDDQIVCDAEMEPSDPDFCDPDQLHPISVFQQTICNLDEGDKPHNIYFSLKSSPIYPSQLIVNSIETNLINSFPNNTIKYRTLERTNRVDIYYWHDRCNRGIAINVWKIHWLCLCPPSYYGAQCEYQSQRVSLTTQIQTISDYRTNFILVAFLIDDRQHIHSYQFINYLSMRDCNIKFNTYLLYSTPSKDNNRNYRVRFDAIDIHTLSYRTSWSFPILFNFLPVYRLAVRLVIPNRHHKQSCSLQCGIHGQCSIYANTDESFCRCESGWSGIGCSTKLDCYCSPDSICVGSVYNRSICVCSLNKFGPRCYLTQTMCQFDTCLNGGTCVAADERIITQSFICLCADGYSGNRCQNVNSKIIVSFRDVRIPTSALFHFIRVFKNSPHNRTTILKKIRIDQNTITIDEFVPFHIVYAELSRRNYYLIVLQEKYTPSISFMTEITPKHRCKSLSELFNSSIIDFHLIRRIKYYHIPCQKQSDLVCFHDEGRMCFCDLYRYANCFDFDHNMIYNCQGVNDCENGAQCFQDKHSCPTISVCSCLECFYGSKCQFSTVGFGLSLDAILAYQIRPQKSLNAQPTIIHVSLGIIVILFFVSIVNGLVLVFTFNTKASLSVGCGLYLLISSFTSLLTITMVGLKLSLLLYSQMNLISNRFFLKGYCTTFDFLIRVFYSADNWLKGCVAIERGITVAKGVRFNKAKSKKVAKWIIGIVLSFCFISAVHDPIHRDLLDDEEDQRVWCITRYSKYISIYDSIILFIHFLLPSSLNIISTLMIIITVARQRSILITRVPYKQHLHQQLLQHRHILISQSILVGLIIPQLILVFLFECMKSSRESWLFLMSYFISFIPTLVTFLVFVLPSETYRKEFQSTLTKIRSYLRGNF